MIVGTADSSPGTVRFYERAGFLRYGVREGFFDACPEPIRENGVRAPDMIMLERRPTRTPGYTPGGSRSKEPSPTTQTDPPTLTCHARSTSSA